MVRTDGRDPEPAEGDLALIVAAHGRDELHALRRALEAGLPYVGLVASPRRGAAVIDELRAAGVDERPAPADRRPRRNPDRLAQRRRDRHLHPRPSRLGSPGEVGVAGERPSKRRLRSIRSAG